MEGSGLPFVNCLLQHTLRSFCSCSSVSVTSSSSKWVYAVFWRILPRNFPPPKWEYGGCMMDRSKGNKRNWILVWEDGYRDFYKSEQAENGYVNGRFGANVFFKMAHEVYNYGEGFVGKVAAENGHRWVFRDSQSEKEANVLSTWNVLQPRAWKAQFNSGIQTILLISIREGVVQLGSFDKVEEDLNLVVNIQRKFSYLQSLPGIFASQRPHIPIQCLQLNSGEITETATGNCSHRLSGKRTYSGQPKEQPPYKVFNLGWNSPQNGRRMPPFLSIPPLYPCTEAHFGDYASNIISRCVKLSKNQRANVQDCGIEMSSAQIYDLKLEATMAFDAQKQRMCPSDLRHDAAGVEMESIIAMNT